MFYRFFGNNFFFIKYCESPQAIEATINRCKKPYKTQDFYVGKTVRRVLDELGNVVFQDPTDRRFKSR